MANISQEVDIELLKKKSDGTYVKENPATRISAIEDLRVNDKHKLEYFDGLEWKNATSEGYRVGNVSNLKADEDDRVVTITLSDPPDTIIKDSAGNDITISKWKGTMVRRKIGSYPIDEDDGELVFDNKIRDKYKTQGYEDDGLINDTEYFYMAFPYTEEDLFTIDSANRISATPTEVDPNSWAGIQKIVRKGLTNEFFTVGDQIASNYDGGEVIWEVIGIDVDTPADSQFQHSMTIQTRDCLHDIQFDAPEPNNPDSGRRNNGNNRYVHSAIRQWLNSNEATFNWQSQHEYDAEPDASLDIYDGPGFLKRLDPELVGVLGNVNKGVAKNTVIDGGGQEVVSDKVFLLSGVEVGFGNEGMTTGEKVYPFYNGVDDAARIKNLNGSPSYWWLRLPRLNYSNFVRCVHASGKLYDYAAGYTIRVSPACVII